MEIYSQSSKFILRRLCIVQLDMTSQGRPLEYSLEGNKKSKELVIFLQGWPDNSAMWEWINWRESLTDYQLMFINFPNTTKTQPEIKFGEDFPVIVDRMKATFDCLKDQKFEKIMLVAHDWGCFYGYLYDEAYPGFFNEIIAMDVPAYVQLQTISQKLMVVAYQLWLFTAFLIGGSIGKFMTQKFAQISKHNPPYFDEITASRNYPYYYMIRNLFLSTLKLKKKFLIGYVPSAPVVYLYGKKKPFQFHGNKWLNYLQTTPNCQIHSVDAGHWFMKKFNKFVVEIIARRIKAKL